MAAKKAQVKTTTKKVTPKSVTKKRVVKTPVKQPEIQKLYRSGEERMIGGVCGGLADYFKVDPTLIRLGWVLSLFIWGIGIPAYALAWIIMPQNPNHKWN